ncbi:hypothetical protein [Streptomyces roseoverticillatus]|nr:hypothetical protein [Streptomyces roseoverticillatus]
MTAARARGAAMLRRGQPELWGVDGINSWNSDSEPAQRSGTRSYGSG